MRFWDTSALIPLVVADRGTALAERLLRDDPAVVVWTLTRVELLSALARRPCQEPAAARRLLGAKREILAAWPRRSEVTAVEVGRRHAERVVDTHAISAAAALQIGAALVAGGDDPAALEFVTFDHPQAAAAEREGFRVRGAS